MERLQKVIANSGYCSRRKAEEFIENGSVKVNGKKAEIGLKVSDSDKIEISGEEISRKLENVYYVLNKPKGVLVTKKDPKGRKTIFDLESV